MDNLSDLQQLVQAQLVRHQVYQNKLDVVSTAEQLVAQRHAHERDFVQQHQREVLTQLQVNGNGKGKNKKKNKAQRGSPMRRRQPVGSSSLSTTSSLPLLRTGAADTTSVMSSFSFDLPLLPSTELNPQARLSPISTPTAGSLKTKSRSERNLSLAHTQTHTHTHSLSRHQSSSKLPQPHGTDSEDKDNNDSEDESSRRPGHSRILKLLPPRQPSMSLTHTHTHSLSPLTSSASAAAAAAMDSAYSAATAGSASVASSLSLSLQDPRLLESVNRMFHETFLRRSAANTNRRRRGQFTENVKPPMKLKGGFDYNKTRDMMNSYIEDIEMLQSTGEQRGVAVDKEIIRKLQLPYFKELSSFDSIALYIETRYIELKEHEASSGTVPNRTKAVVAADLIMKLTRVLGRYSTILEPLLWELLNSIFDGYAEMEKRFTAENFLTELSKLNLYHDLYHHARSSLEDVNEELQVIHQGHNMKRIVKKFQTVRLAFDEASAFIRDACFKVWKRYTKFRSRLQKIGSKRGLRYRFNTWRQHIKDRNLRSLADYSQDLDVKIARLSELSTIVEQHNAEQISKIMSSSVAGTVPSTPLARLSSISTDGTDMRTGLKPVNRGRLLSNPQERLSQQKEAVDNLNKKISRSLGTIALVAASPGISRSVSVDVDELDDDTVGPLPYNHGITSALHISNIQTQFDGPFTPVDFRSGASTPTFRDAREHTLNVIEQTARLTTQIMADYHDEMTQTPDDWMMDVREPVLGFLNTEEVKPPPDTTPAQEKKEDLKTRNSHLPPIGSKIHQKYEMTVYAADELIALIYEAKLIECGGNIEKLDFRQKESLMEFSKNFLLSRYSLRRMCAKFYKELVATCMRDYRSRPRLEMFSILCGFPLPDSINPKYDVDRCTFFFQALHMIFEGNAEFMRYTFSTKIIDREIVLDKLPTIFEVIHSEKLDSYQNLVFEVVDLRCVDLSQVDVTYKIDVDEMLMVIMEYYDVEIAAHCRRQFGEDWDGDEGSIQ